MRNPPNADQNNGLHEGNIEKIHVIVEQLNAGHSNRIRNIRIAKERLPKNECEPVEDVDENTNLSHVDLLSDVLLRKWIANVEQ